MELNDSSFSQNISRMAVCDTDQKEITIDETYCWSTDHRGRPIDIYSDPDYRMQCIGYWKENLKSYLITYDQLDAFTKYRCWVYQRADLNKMLMSMSVGPYCDLGQDVDSSNWTQGAVVSLVMDENERECECYIYYAKMLTIAIEAAKDNSIKYFLRPFSRPLPHVLQRRRRPMAAGGEPHQGL